MNLPTFSTLNLSLTDGIADLRLNRPEKSNAMNDAMWQEIRQAFDWIDRTPQRRARPGAPPPGSGAARESGRPRLARRREFRANGRLCADPHALGQHRRHRSCGFSGSVGFRAACGRAEDAASALEAAGAARSSASADLLRLHADLATSATRHQELISRFRVSNPGVAITQVPAAARDIHDLDGLRAVGADLAG